MAPREWAAPRRVRMLLRQSSHGRLTAYPTQRLRRVIGPT
ncbi:hypothetical protein NY78_1137 [Desulfovibrio sp. TomC]|nr:hypothetical protein NY78_1137 [Desulfovibrio sp. TomC]